MPSLTVPVRQVTHSTPRTRIINLDVSAAASAGKGFSFQAGQAVMLGLHGSGLRRPYSIASAPWEFEKTGTLQVFAHISESDALDPHLELASPGTPLDLEGPFGTFAVSLSVTEPLLFVAGGTGIAPLRSILIDHLARPVRAPIALIYSARSADEFGFRAGLDALQAAGRLAVFYTVTRDEAWAGRRGRIDEALLKTALPSTDASCLICGPPQLVSDTSLLLRKLGVAEEKILVEKY